MAISTSPLINGVPKISFDNKPNFNKGKNNSSKILVNFNRISSRGCPVSSRLSTRRSNRSSLACRWSDDRQCNALSSVTKSTMGRQRGFILTEHLPMAIPAADRLHMCCNHLQHKRGSFARNFKSKFSSERSMFQMSRSWQDNTFVRRLPVRCASVGPDEPHAVSTSWPDGTLEKTELDILDPEIIRLEVEGFLNTELPSHPKLYRGQLKNGLRYIILPNKVPPNRFEAHMEVHVGSVDEEDDEQGIAHMIEHVAFLGSKKREKLLGTGARSNAYTDFHHTVFHIHSPMHAKVRRLCFG